MNKGNYDQGINEEAGKWLARLQSDEFSFQNKAAFQAWLTSDPAHAAAFEDATNIWGHLGAIPRDSYLVGEKKNRHLDRRAVMAGAAALAFAGTSAPFLFRSAKAETYQTSVGEQKTIGLPDGTTVLLDTDTCISARFNSNVRQLELKYGRISCRVVQDPRRFAVKVADKLVVGNKSVFDLSYLDNDFSVFLIKGNATVSSGNNSIAVTEGERSSAYSSRPLEIDKPDRSLLMAWQSGRLIFKNETIGEAVQEMNRYSSVKLQINDPQLASRRISGGYRAGDNEAFAESLAQLLPMQFTHHDGVIHLLSTHAS